MKRAASATVRVERAVDGHPAVRVDLRRGRDAAALRLEPEQPAAGGGDADRAGAVGAERGATPARRRPRSPSRRSSRRDVRCRSHGLRVTPNVGDSVNGVAISSGTWVLPMITAPAARSRRDDLGVGGLRRGGSASQP